MDRLTELRRSTGAALCVDCGKCTSTCPLSAFGPFSARAIASLDTSLSDTKRSAAIGRCLTCAACEQRCPQGVQFTSYVKALRESISPEDREPCPHGEVLSTSARMMSEERRPGARPEWLSADLRVASEGELALFVGCLPLFDAMFAQTLGVKTTEIARAAVRLLNHAGIEPVIISDERCCGHDLLWRGEVDTFHDLAQANAAAFAERGVNHIVTTCAECCRTWRMDIAEAVSDYRPRVEHIAEFLSARIQRKEMAFTGNGARRVTFQDPCRLGRHLGVYDAPRTVLEAVPDVVLQDMDHAGRDAQCCGTSGFIYCDATSRQMQARRLQTAAATGAEKLITACPKCLLHFSCAQAEDQQQGRGKPAIEVQDLTVFAAERLQESMGRNDQESSGET